MARPIRRSDDAPDTTGQAATPVGWDPLLELEQLNQRLTGYLELWRQAPSLIQGVFTPPADVEETDDAYLVDIELPGVRRHDLDMEVAGRRLAVRGERKAKERGGILRRRERTTGRFQYEVALPGDVDEDGVTAEFDNGVLTVRVPKPESERPSHIDVH